MFENMKPHFHFKLKTNIHKSITQLIHVRNDNKY
jgi:hypothetical protein